jgi:hypothetical protein
VAQYGFRAIIAPRKEVGGASLPAFADIFRQQLREERSADHRVDRR